MACNHGSISEGNMNASDNNTLSGKKEKLGSCDGIPSDAIPALVIMVFILLINSGVILVITCNSHLRKTSNIILASLAVSDLLVGLIGIPLMVTCTSTFSVSVCQSSIIFFSFTAMSTISHIMVMTCDCYVYIIWALHYPEIITRSRVLAILALIWLVSLSAIVRLSWTLQVTTINTAADVLAKVEQKENAYLLFQGTVFFVIPLVVMTVLDTRMLLLLRQQYQRIMKENLPAEYVCSENRFQSRQRKVVFISIFLLLLYVICWLPYFILDFMHFYAAETVQALPAIPTVLIYYLRLSPALFNPLLYTLRKPDLKKAVKSLAFKFCPRLQPVHLAENRTEELVLTSRSDSKAADVEETK
ncbi:histamine H2 receptor-like [Montipora capricornis]|uniref:histamine H2 receptor-like n=1 Tax=Montipora capricornis TaxID=246305 RepID=UPI0035F1F54E